MRLGLWLGILLPFSFACLGHGPSAAEEPERADTHSRRQSKLDWPFDRLPSPAANADTRLAVAVQGDAAIVAKIIEQQGGRLITRTARVCTASIPVKAVAVLLDDPAVTRVTLGRPMRFYRNPHHMAAPAPKWEPPQRPLAERRPAVADPGLLKVLRGGSPLERAYTGKGVLVAVIEGAIPDFRHPDFRQPDGRTRFHAIWDMGAIGKGPDGFGYGKLYTREDIDRVIADGGPGLVFGDAADHMTQSLGVAAGNGSVRPDATGVAPEATLMAVNYGYSDQALIDAVAFLFGEADRLGMPCVISISAAISKLHGSPEDGEDLPSQALTDLVEAKAGRLLCVSAGNQASTPFHVRLEAAADDQVRQSWLGPVGEGDGQASLRVQSAKSDAVQLQLALVDRTAPEPGRTATPWMTPADFLQKGLHRFGLAVGDGTTAQVELSVVPQQRAGASVALWLRARMLAKGTRGLSIAVRCKGKGVVDGWGDVQLAPQSAAAGSPGRPPAGYVEPDALLTMCCPASARSVFAVGAYQWPSGQMTSYSQGGGRLHGEWKPLALAPVGIPATVPLDVTDKPGEPPYRTYAGTSCASPVFAGAAALYLQKEPRATVEQFVAKVRATSTLDEQTGRSANPACGYGKVNFLRLLTR